MKKILKTVSLLAMLSLVVALCAPVFIFADYVYTSDNAVVYNPSIVSYYWGWDKDWSVPTLYLSNGWHCSHTDSLYAFTKGSYRGKVGYCIAPGVVFTDQATYYTKEGSYLDQVADQNPVLSKDEIISLAGYILAAGFKGDLKQSYFENESSGKDAFGCLWATQVLLWELVTGERDKDFNYLGPESGYSRCMDAIRPSNPIYGKFLEHYDIIAKKVRSSLNIPSFASLEGGSSAPSYELKWDGKSFSVTLSDENGVLDGYSFYSGNTELRTNRQGSEITIYSDDPMLSLQEVVLTKEISSDNFMVWGSPNQNDFSRLKDDPNGCNQALIFDSGTVTVTKNAYINLWTAPGEISIYKTSSNCSVTDDNRNYSLEGAVYGVYEALEEAGGDVDSSSLIGNIVTDKDGIGSTACGISAGKTYYVKEIESPKGYLLDKKIYEVRPLGTGSEAAIVSSQEDPVNDPITLTIKKESASQSQEIQSLEGTEFTFKYYDEDPDQELSAEDLEGKTPLRTWIIKVRAKEIDGDLVYTTLLDSEHLEEGSDELFLSNSGEVILPAGYLTIKETKASDGYTTAFARYYSGGELISEGNRTIVGRVLYDGSISPEGIDVTMMTVTNEPAIPEDDPSPKTMDRPIYYILAVLSAAVLIGYLSAEKEGDRKRSKA